MKVLVATAAYPTNDGKRPQYFVHSRNLYYQKNGIDVTVLNFAIEEEYSIDGIRVVGLKHFDPLKEKYDLLICHAANLRNHYVFLKKYDSFFAKIVFVFHGHEILHINKYYPKPYDYVKKSKIPAFVQNMYDSLKIRLWKNYWSKNIDRIRLVFVSEWIRSQFYKETGFTEIQLKCHDQVISNSIGKFFEETKYSKTEIEFDFITIRNYLDGSKYAADIVVNLAKNFPKYNFLIIGKGEFFKHYKKPENVTWINKEMSHEEIATYLNKSRFALLPTREDTQGLMACEVAAFGIPLITSDIEVCLEVFKTCHNVAFINNENPDLEQAVNKLKKAPCGCYWDQYYAENTIMKEIKYLKEFAGIKE